MIYIVIVLCDLPVLVCGDDNSAGGFEHGAKLRNAVWTFEDVLRGFRVRNTPNTHDMMLILRI